MTNIERNHQGEQGSRLPIIKHANIGKLPGFRMTQRDKEVIKAVYTHRALTTPQIEVLLFPPDNGQRGFHFLTYS